MVEPVEEDLTYPEKPVQILDQMDRVTRSRTVKFYKIQWSNHSEDEATLEQEDYLEANHPGFLAAHMNQWVH